MKLPSGERFGSSTSRKAAQSSGFSVRGGSAAADVATMKASKQKRKIDQCITSEQLVGKISGRIYRIDWIRRIKSCESCLISFRIVLFLTPAPAEGIAAMRPTAADRALTAGGRFGLEERRIEIREALQFQARDFLSHEALDRVERCQLFAVHQGESVADILGAAGPANPVHVVFGMLGHIVIDDVTDA